jgi:DNA invertase Pin-like site-specific DNA recombinase
MKRLMVTAIATLTMVSFLSAAEVDQREKRQQKRIAQGVASGQLTPKETSKIERKEAAVRREIHHDRAKNGGQLTAREKAKVNRQENRLSREIARDKHN